MSLYVIIIKAGGIAMVKEIVAEGFESEVLGADVPVLVDFWAEWCSPCRMMGPVFKELSTEIGSQMKFFKLNVETERQVADYFGVMSIPTLILFKDGEEVLRLTGLRKKEAMLEELKPYLS
jgi:thioredoxin 1